MKRLQEELALDFQWWPAAGVSAVAEPLPVKHLSRGFLDRFHDQQEVRVERAPDLLTLLAGAVRVLIEANRTDVPPDGLDVLLNVVALHRLDSLCHLWKELEQCAPGRLLQAAFAAGGPIRANRAISISDNRLQFN
jgi:hypothetical protein